ncbi:MAG: ABC transporter ATP-binding protein [Gammaproteobacteria bacterium]
MQTLPTTLFGFIWHFLKQQRAAFIGIQLFALAWSLDNTVWPIGIKLLIDSILAYDGGNVWIYLMPVLFFWGGLWITIEIMFRLQGFMLAKTMPRLEANLRMAMFRYVQGHSYTYFANHFAGNISNRISDMTQSVARLLQITMAVFIPALVALIIATTIFFIIDMMFAVLLFGWVILHLGVCFAFANKCSALSKVHATSRSFLTGKIVDAFTNIINVKLFARQRYEYAYAGEYQKDERDKQYSAFLILEKIKIILGILSFIFPGILLTWYLIYSWQQGSITVGDLVLIFNTNWNIMTIVWLVGAELPNFFKEVGICQQALTLIQVKHEIVDPVNAKTLLVKKGDIHFDAVNFHYTKTHQVFKNINLHVKAGTKVGLVGFSGSGKSTFVNLILRFFEVESGHIRIDGTDITQVSLESLRNQIAMIPQDPTLFHRTIMDNIRYGNIDASDEAVFTAAKQAHCHEFIHQLPEHYQALVGERGIKLSGGQRQRIAIARAILKNAPVLILDEATSSLDSITEKHIQDGLHHLMQDKTTIVIAHRLSTLAEMDRILVFDQGHIIEDGTHQQLLQQQGHYAKMWHMQAGGFLPDHG